ncbi:hypothetical protein BJY01DRAFT_27503 [Aspergillus pseudoustus]|uniref:Zn(2)-C6 fungal-type domain-containing protein n=1 Tax=Aspergillus pseudoustus TaxID=1810923 RepID=A0ABR4JHR6_9EURO
MSVSPPTRSPPERIGPLRSRRGCKTCRVRKIKCGEEKPSCHRCLTAKYKCEYSSNTNYSGTFSSASSAATTSILDRPLSTSPNAVMRERRAFAYYFQHAAPYLAGGLDQTFWGSVVPQICRTEPAVWDAVNAISTLFESPKMCADFVFLSLRHEKAAFLDQEQSEALVWYSRSLSKIRTQIDRGSVDPQVALISCVLFVCIETLQGHVEEALQLYYQGVRLILDLRANGGGGPNSSAALLESTIMPLFIRLGTVALTYSGVPVCDLFDLINLEGEYNFTSLEAARDALMPLAYKVLILQKDSGSNPWLGIEPNITPELLATQITLQERLKQWYFAYTKLNQTTEPKGPSSNSSSNSDISITALLLTYHTTLTMIVATCLTQSKSVYDAHTPEFRTILKQASTALDASASSDASQPTFTFELGVGLPLFWTALECREPSLRRRALALLQKAPPMQGFYKCAPGIALAGKIMQLEEGFARQILIDKRAQDSESCHLPTPPYDDTDDGNSDCLEIPEEARIRHYSVFRPRDQPFLLGPHDVSQWERGSDQLYMRFTRYRPDCAYWEEWGLTDEIVPME